MNDLMNPDVIVQSLQMCVLGLCECCPYDGKNEERLCADGLRLDAVKVIERLQSIIERQRKENNALKYTSISSVTGGKNMIVVDAAERWRMCNVCGQEAHIDVTFKNEHTNSGIGVALCKEHASTLGFLMSSYVEKIE